MMTGPRKEIIAQRLTWGEFKPRGKVRYRPESPDYWVKMSTGADGWIVAMLRPIMTASQDYGKRALQRP